MNTKGGEFSPPMGRAVVDQNGVCDYNLLFPVSKQSWSECTFTGNARESKGKSDWT